MEATNLVNGKKAKDKKWKFGVLRPVSKDEKCQEFPLQSLRRRPTETDSSIPSAGSQLVAWSSVGLCPITAHHPKGSGRKAGATVMKMENTLKEGRR